MNKFNEKYSSKIPRILIPLPDFKFFHGVYSEKEKDPKFIRREKIVNQLKSWLVNTDIETGVYLVTGFRGMGKSSFVGKVLHEVTYSEEKGKNTNARYATLGIIAAFYFLFLALYSRNAYNFPDCAIKIIAVFLFILSVCFILFVFIPLCCVSREEKEKIKRIPIHLNLGFGNLNEKHVMSLISKSIEEQYAAYRKNIILNIPVILIKYISISFLVLITSLFLWVIFIDSYSGFKLGLYINKIYSVNFNSLHHSLQYLLYYILHFIPQTILYFSVWGILFYVWKFVLKIVHLLFDSPSSIENKIKDLNERISAEVNEESSTSSGIKKTIEFSLSRKKEKKYALANAREIEFELTNILKSMSVKRIFWKYPPEFIIIFDELDKIDPFMQNDTPEDPNILPEFEHAGNIFPGGAASRKKKNTLLKMLANMKFFVSTAKTKFIFIAGRELYDAFLADFSDREFTIGSIFSNVIYVDSFLSSDLNEKDITRNTEHFICKQIMPVKENENDDYYSFRKYYKLLSNQVKNRKITKKEAEKTITFLHQFAVYLSHISNGAPKKIAIHFEKYIQQMNYSITDKSQQKDEILQIPDIGKKTSFYLSFGYKDQQKIGFIHYMAFPVVNALINNATQYGDKLLVSACFLTNHIYKFHNNGFSWRNLENIPEINDVNKTPELREFIHTIISFLKQSHLSTTISGLYNFKFPMKITEEISIMSKFSEEVSALFNFTLDDSLSVKRLYERSLKYYAELNKQDKATHDDLHHIIASIHHILGDLNLFDEKYNEAIFEYQCCLKNLGKFDFNSKKPHSTSHILYLIRIMLKLALTHEKRKTYNSAYTTYNKLISLLIQYRYIDESDYGLKYLQIIKEDDSSHYWHSKTDILYKDENESITGVPKMKETTKSEKDASKFEKYIYPEVIINTEFKDKLNNIKFHVEGPEIISHFARQLTPKKHNLIVSLTMFEDIRLVYQAIIAKLFLLEKKGLNGITKESLDTMESEFNFLHRTVNSSDKYILSADFFRKIADILYYKNGFVNYESVNNYFSGWYIWDYNIENDIYNYCAINGYKDYKTLSKLKDIKYNHKSKLYRLDDLTTEEVGILMDFIYNFMKIPTSKGIEWSYPLKDVFLFKRGYKKNNIAPSIIIYEDKNYSKISKCNQRRRLILSNMSNDMEITNSANYKRTPCYACKYYNRSLKILLKNLMGEKDIDHQISKSILILRSINDKTKMKSLKESEIVVLSHCLDGLGNVLLSCSHGRDEIRTEFLTHFFSFVEEGDLDYIEKTELSHLEKAILYFWGAAYYFKLSSNKKEASCCYKKIIQLLVAYVSNSNQTYNEEISNKVKHIFFTRAIQNLYIHYENTNITEIQKLKYYFDKEIYEKIPLNLLSIFPDLEELILAYTEFELFGNENKKSVGKLYQSTFLSSNRLINTISERIYSLRLKAIINMKILHQLLGFEDYIYKKDFPVKFFSKYADYYFFPYWDIPIKSLKGQLGKYACCFCQELIENDTIDTRKNLLDFLIKDTMFCLSKIIETLSPSIKTTLVTDSYMGFIYKLLFECNRLFELILISYKWADTHFTDTTTQPNQKAIIDKIMNYISDENDKEKDYSKLQTQKREKISFFKRYLGYFLSAIREKYIADKCSYSKTFLESISQKIDKINTHLNISNYMAEMALKKLRSAREMHREGAAYKEMISNMYFLDDDLNNDTNQFYLALERYANNCQIIDRSVNDLKDICKNSNLLKVDKYINPDDN